ncbi:MAG: hypothetical protein R2778_00695 [Saprospiraceae bacterium]
MERIIRSPGHGRFPRWIRRFLPKAEEIKRALEEGANDIDAVINIAYVKSAQWNLVRRDIRGLPSPPVREANF